MAKRDPLLFAQEELEKRAIEILSKGPEKLSIAYVGPSLVEGRMDATLLADGLKGYARFVNRVAEMYLGSLGEGFYLEIQGEPRSGSIEVFIHFFHPLRQSIEALSDSKLLQGLAILATLTGLSVRDIGKSLIWLFKRTKGRPIKDGQDLTSLPKELPIETKEYIKLFNDAEVQAAIRSALRPLRESGIDSFQTRYHREPIDSVTKQDLLAADAAELEAVIPDEDKTLDIEKVSFFPHLAWHLSDGVKPFDAKIEDPTFWEQISAGDRFGYGDRMRVRLHIEAERDNNGRLRTTRTVTKVYSVDRSSGQQMSLL